RVFEAGGADGRPKLIATHDTPTPALRLAPGDYYINVAFGKANMTRKIHVTVGAAQTEQFALNVGLLKISALSGSNTPLAAGAVFIEVFADERDRFGEPRRIISGAKPGVLIRLNSGLYHIVSRYGDANATVQSDFTVEPGKLTEATVIHHAASVSFKLVSQPGGDATPQTQWTIVDREGDIVKKSTGALPSHTLAPGTYTVTARTQGQVFRRQFTVRSGDIAQVEVVMQER
ncbi:MAG: hypothetical protein AB7O43_16220, partial [Hyphomicrobiaceae bacterium]